MCVLLIKLLHIEKFYIIKLILNYFSSSYYFFFSDVTLFGVEKTFFGRIRFADSGKYSSISLIHL